MAASLGSLVVSLGLDASEYVQGLTRAEYQAKKFSDTAVKGFKAAAAGTTLIIAGVTAAGYALERALSGVANYKQIGEQIGDTAQNVSALQEAADRSGTALDSVAASSVKLTKTMEGVVKTTEGAGAALNALGINAEEFKRLAPVERLQALADASAKFKDSGSKTSALEQFFGKGVRDIIPFLNDLAEVGSKNSRFTQEQIEQTDKLKKATDALGGVMRDTSRLMATDFVPALSEIIKKFKEGYTEGGLFKGAVLGLGQAFVELGRGAEARELKGRIKEIDESISTIRGQLKSGSLNPENKGGLFSFLIPDAKLGKDAIASFEKELLRLETAKQALTGQLNGPPKLPPAAEQPEVPFNEDALKQKSALDKRFIELAKLTADEQLSITKSSETQAMQVLEQFNQQGLYSITDYYETRKNIIKYALAGELQALNQKISAEKAAAKDARADKEYDKENAALLNVQRLLVQKSELQRKANGELQLDTIKQAEAMERFKNEIKEVNIQILELTGKTADAARARGELSSDNLRKRLTASGDSAGLASLDTLNRLNSAKAQFNEELTKQSDLTTRLGIEEERIQNSQRTGAISEIESLQKTGQARAAAIGQLEAIVRNLEEVARASQNPALILQAEQARASLEKLRSETDLLAQKFDTVFKDSFTSAFSDFVSGTKSAKDAFLDFSKSVAGAITNLVAQDFAKGILKQFGGNTGGGASGLGGFFAQIFGSGGGGAAAGGGISSFFQGMGAVPYANGTDYVPRDMLAFVHRGEKITPANQNNGGGNGDVYMTVVTRDAGSFNSSRGQVAANLSTALAAGRRNL